MNPEDRYSSGEALPQGEGRSVPVCSQPRNNTPLSDTLWDTAQVLREMGVATHLAANQYECLQCDLILYFGMVLAVWKGQVHMDMANVTVDQ